MYETSSDLSMGRWQEQQFPFGEAEEERAQKTLAVNDVDQHINVKGLEAFLRHIQSEGHSLDNWRCNHKSGSNVMGHTADWIRHMGNHEEDTRYIGAVEHWYPNLTYPIDIEPKGGLTFKKGRRKPSLERGIKKRNNRRVWTIRNRFIWLQIS